MKNIWNGIKSLITLTDIFISAPMTLNHNSSSVTHPVEIVNVFNNHLTSVAEKARANANCSHKHFNEYMENKFSKSFF